MTRAPRIAGIDLSLTATGIAQLIPDSYTPTLNRVITKPRKEWDSKTQGKDWDGTSQRITRIAQACRLVAPHATLLVVEGPSYGSKGSAMHDLGGLWWGVYDQLRDLAPVLVVPPAQLKQWATGTGGGAKAGVGRAMGQMWAEVTSNDDNELDALALASLGLHWVHRDEPDRLPFTVTKYRADVLAKLQAPVIPDPQAPGWLDAARESALNPHKS